MKRFLRIKNINFDQVIFKFKISISLWLVSEFRIYLLIGDTFMASYRLSVITDEVIVVDLLVIVSYFSNSKVLSTKQTYKHENFVIFML